jgi:hypothetical protein
VLEEPPPVKSNSDDDMELSLLVRTQNKFLPCTAYQSLTALSVLVDPVGRGSNSQNRLPPGRDMNADASLRNQLLAKQRKMGTC